jgi:hypothetical protein
MHRAAAIRQNASSCSGYGETAREFAAKHGVKASTLSGWAWRLGRDRAADAGRQANPLQLPASKVIELRGLPVQMHEECFELEVGRRRVRVPPSFDEDALRRLIGVLEGAP